MEGSASTTQASSASTLVPSQLAALVPTYDPSKDDLEIFTQKVELLSTTWPSDKFGELATRLILGCSGTAFLKLQQHRDTLTVNDKKSVQKIIEILGGQWGQIPLERKYEAAERALYRCMQRSDETNDSFLARADVLWQDLLNKGIKVEELQAYVTLRGSNLGPEDKKKVIMDCDSVDGKLSMKKVASAVRMLGAGFFHEMTTGKRSTKLKVYDQAVLMAEDEDLEDGVFQAYGDELPLEEDMVESLAGDGDDDAMLVMEFESAASELVQEDTELAAAFNSYTEARRRLSEKFKHRGFFPSSSGKGKHRFSKGGKGKGFKSGFGARKSLQQRILNSTCRICGRKGHWKAECPNRGDGAGSSTLSSSSGAPGMGSSFTGSAITQVPEGLSLEFLNLQEFGTTAIDEVSMHDEFVFFNVGENRKGLREALDRVENPQGHSFNSRIHHHQSQTSLRSEDRSCPESRRNHVDACVESRDILPEVAESWVATAYSNQAKGVLDSGATKTVIGSNLVDNLLKSLDPEVRKRVTRSHCQVTFRFGNLSTLDAHHALVIPVGVLNLRVAIVPGNTPFLISNTLVRALKSVIDTHQHQLRSPELQYPLNLELTERGLFLLDINELVKASSVVTNHRPKQDTFVTEDVQKTTAVSPLGSEPSPDSCCVKIDRNHMSKDMNRSSPLEESQLHAQPNLVCEKNNHDRSIPIAEVQDSLIDCNRVSLSSCGHGGSSSTPQEPPCGCPRGGGRLEQVLRPTISRHEDRLRQLSPRQNVPSNVEGSSNLGKMDDSALQSESKTQSSACDPLLLSGDRALRVDWTSSATDGCPCREDCESAQAQGQKSGLSHFEEFEAQRQDRVGDRMGVARPRDGPRGPDCPPGGASESRDQSRDSSTERAHESNGRDVVPDCATSSEAVHSSLDPTDLAWLTLHAGDSDSVDFGKNPTLDSLSVDQKHFQKLLSKFTHEFQECYQSYCRTDKHQLFEVFCGGQSPLVQQCRGKAQRFCRERGDLQTSDGRKDLFREIHRCQPEHIWMSPSCNPWCGFSTLNGSRSLQAWDELQSNRRFHLEQVALGLVLFRYQVEHQRHLHWEQPRTSVMFRLPILKELYVQTFAAEFDMCQFGLRDPQSKELIKKSMIVRTTSQRVFKAIHGCKCSQNHQHQPIEGSVVDKGVRVNRSQYTERYPRKFARTIALALDKIEDSALANSSRVTEDGTAQSGRLSKRFRASPTIRAKGEVSRVSEPSQQLHPKRRRIEGKHEATITIADGWKHVIDRCAGLVPRVGKVVIEEPTILQCVQDLIDDKKVCFLVAGRGSDRTMPPCKEIVNGEAPFRKSVFLHRQSEKLLIEDSWEAWENLAKRQLVRSSHPCKFHITIFARNPDSDEPVSQPPRDLTDLDGRSLPNVDITGTNDPGINPSDSSRSPMQNADLQQGKHGPKFLKLPQAIRQMILKAHVNLGHPSKEKLQELFRQQGYDFNIVEGISDLACSTCLMHSKPKSSRPGAIHVPMDFNDRISIDGLKFTNQQGQVFHILHVIDLSTNFHTAVIAPSRTTESTIVALIQTWLSWAGAPIEIVMDSATELNSEEFMTFLQQYNIRPVTTAPEAHWQNGRAERHGAIVESMLQKIDCEYPIVSYSHLQRCLWHVMQAKNACSIRKGYSPEMLVFGKSTRLPGSLCGDDQLPAHCLADSETAQGIAFRDHLLLRETARKAFFQADNDSTLRRAVLRRNRPSRQQYSVGEWVMIWRTIQTHQSWCGPMQVVTQDGQHTVWTTQGGKLYRSAPENVRPVSAYETTLIPAEGHLSSKFIDGLNQQIERSRELESETPEITAENTPPVNPPDNVAPGVQTSQEVPTENSLPEIPDVSSSSQPDQEPEVENSTNEPLPSFQVPVPESSDEELLCQGLIAQDVEPTFFIHDSFDHLSWRIEINIGDKEIEEWRQEDNPHDMLFLATAAKRQRSEVKLSTLNAKEYEEFQLAKKSEIMNWLKTDTVCKMLRNQLAPEEILRCRWVLTWKPIEESDRDKLNPKDKKAKARLVVLGYLDPSIEKLNRDSPTLSKHARMLLLQLIASKGWNLQSFDIKAAFLQGKTQKDRIIGIEPVPELVEALKLRPNEICRLTKSAYGLIDAPYLWYQTLKEELLNLGFEVSPFDPCLYTLRDQNHRPRGVIGIHVDDGLCGGDEFFKQKLSELQKKYPFGSQKLGEFVFTGVHLTQKSDKSIILSQSEYVCNINPIRIDSNRKSLSEDKVTEDERQQLRAIIGSLQYASVNTRPDIASRLSYLQSRVNDATVSTLVEANRILHEAKRHHDVSITIQPIACEDLRLLAFSDASFASKSTPDSHSGCIVMATHKDISQNLSCPVSPLSWGCKKIQKVVTSTLSAETMSLSSTLDQLSWLKLFWAWLLDSRIKWDKPEDTLKDLPLAFSSVTHKLQEIGDSIAATDCKSLYDLVTRTAPPNCSEFRTQLQARAIKNLMAEGIKLRWVHSGAQLADALTKIMEASFLRETLKRGHYKLHDELEILKQRSHNRTRLKWLRSGGDSISDECNVVFEECEEILDFLGV